jgi:tetratricopeptide (TPR) repeat protein
VFAGGCVLESAEEICAWDGLKVEDVLEYLINLVGKSLVGSHEGADGGMRYGLLETIRAYAAERARETGEADALAERHAACFLQLAEAAEPELQGPEQARWLDRLEEEHDNLRQAFQTFIPRQAEAALRLCGALWRFWWVRGNWKEGRDWLESALNLEGSSQRTLLRSKALRGASRLALTQGGDDAARALLNEGLEIAREQQDKAEIAACLFELGNVANQHELLAEARQLYGECLALQREIGDRRGTSLTLHNLAVVAEARQEFAEAHSLYREALALHRSLGNQAMEAATRNGLGVLAVAQGDLFTARTHHEEALAIQRDLGDKGGIAFSLRELGAIVAEQGDVPTACAHLAECMEILRELGDRQELAPAIEACAGVAAKARESERALRLAGAALALRDELASPISKSDEEVLQGRLAGARKALGAEASQRLMEEGRVLGVEQAIELAIETGSQAAARLSVPIRRDARDSTS